MGTIKKLSRNVTLLVLLLAVFAVGASGLLPSEMITCRGCSLSQDAVDKFSTWIVKDTAVTFIGPTGY